MKKSPQQVMMFDADGTLFEGFSLGRVFSAFADDGYIDGFDQEKQLELNHRLTSGKIDYEAFVAEALLLAADAIRGKPQDGAHQIAKEVVAADDFPWHGYVDRLFDNQNVRESGLVLITAEPQFVADAIAQALGFTGWHSSTFGVESDANYSGHVTAVLDSVKKGNIARYIASQHRRSAGFGDSIGDVEMLRAVGRGVCIQPRDDLRETAETEGWIIVEDPNGSIAYAQVKPAATTQADR